MVAAGHFLAVDPQPDFAVDAADVVVVPLTYAFAQVLSRKTPLSVRRRWRKRIHGGGAGREHVAVGGEPVRLLFGLFFILLGIGVIEYLDFNSGRKPPPALFQRLDRFGCGPDKNSGVAARLQVPPLGDQFEIREQVGGSDHTRGFAGAMDDTIAPTPRVRIAVDVDEMLFAQDCPAGAGAVDARLGKRT